MNKTQDEVRKYYLEAAKAGPTRREDLGNDDRWGTANYDADTLEESPDAAAGLSMGCGNPFALADLSEGEVVLDLGSGAGLDIILSARRVGPTGHAYGVDYLDEMLDIARTNASKADVTNVEFLAGTIEQVPLPDNAVDVVISNCVINLVADKAPVFAEMARVVRPGGRIAISDVVLADDAPEPDPADAVAWAECGAGGLRYANYVTMLTDAGFTSVTIELTHEVGPGMHGAAIRATLPQDHGDKT